VVQKTDRHEFSFPELYVKADRTVKSESRFGFGHIRTADLGKYGFIPRKINPVRDIWRLLHMGPNMWPIESKEAIDVILQIGDSYGVPSLVILKITDRGELLVNVE
jgi:hypothetical protein